MRKRPKPNARKHRLPKAERRTRAFMAEELILKRKQRGTMGVTDPEDISKAKFAAEQRAKRDRIAATLPTQDETAAWIDNKRRKA
jgi:hypothetical protein